MLMSHTDTVPIGDESKWKHPPFSATLDNGRIYGMGADDCKGFGKVYGALMAHSAKFSDFQQQERNLADLANPCDIMAGEGRWESNPPETIIAPDWI